MRQRVDISSERENFRFRLLAAAHLRMDLVFAAFPVVSFAAVFWMSRNVSKERYVTSQ